MASVFLLLALVSGASAASVTVPVAGNVLQSISISAAGTATGLSLNVGDNIIDGVSITRNNNVPIKIAVADLMGASKPENVRGHMSNFIEATSQYAVPANQFITEHARVAYGSGAYFTVDTTSTVLLQENLPAGTATDVLHIRQNVLPTDQPLATGYHYQMTLQIDTIPA